MAGLTHKGVSYGEMIGDMRLVFNTGKTKAKAWREAQLRAVIKLVTEQKQALCDVLKKDLNKDEFDSVVDEIAFCEGEAHWFIENLGSLMSNQKVSLSVVNLGGNGFIKREPLGVVLNITAWNYPVQLALGPLLTIIAAGNCCVIKPSELSPHTSRLLAELVPMYLDSECIKVVEGGVEETTALLKERWDHILYTGNGFVGRIIYKAAAEFLTPCTLELGGKCPTYVDDYVDLESVCNRIVWGKFKNCGQTCLAMDYILVHEKIKEQFVEVLCRTIEQQYTKTPANSPDYGRIVNERHYRRICDLLDSAPDKDIRIGGDRQMSALYFGPTVVTGIKPSDKIMQEEIFGPLLPVLSVSGHKEAIDFINSREKPLHAYIYSHRQAVMDEFLERTSSGGFSGNDGMVIRAEKTLPFGGVGSSGIGCYGSEIGFLNFSHQKPVLIKPMGMEWMYKMMRYAPHTPTKLNRFLLTFKLARSVKYLKVLLIGLVVIGTFLALFLGLAKAGYIPRVDL